MKTKEMLTMVLDKETRKMIENLEKQRDKELKKLDTEHQKKLEKIAKDRVDVKPGIFSKSKVIDIKDPRFWTLVNVGAMKEFIKYGSNKVLDQIRTRTHAAILAREEIERAKKNKSGFDFKTGIIVIAVAAIVGTVAYITVTSYLNANGIATDLMNEKRLHGTDIGKLAVCEQQLYYYNPSLVPHAINASNGSVPYNPGGGTLVG